MLHTSGARTKGCLTVANDEEPVAVVQVASANFAFFSSSFFLYGAALPIITIKKSIFKRSINVVAALLSIILPCLALIIMFFCAGVHAFGSHVNPL